MSVTTTEESTITAKTRELCQSIVDVPEFQSIRSRIEAYLADDAARGLFDTLDMKRNLLQQKQQTGLPLADEEIEDYERHRQQVLGNKLVVGYLEAQNDMGKIQDTIFKHITKTFELGRVPEADDLSDGSCCNSSGCGCH